MLTFLSFITASLQLHIWQSQVWIFLFITTIFGSAPTTITTKKCGYGREQVRARMCVRICLFVCVCAYAYVSVWVCVCVCVLLRVKNLKCVQQLYAYAFCVCMFIQICIYVCVFVFVNKRLERGLLSRTNTWACTDGTASVLGLKFRWLWTPELKLRRSIIAGGIFGISAALSAEASACRRRFMPAPLFAGVALCRRRFLPALLHAGAAWPRECVFGEFRVTENATSDNAASHHCSREKLVFFALLQWYCYKR